MKSNTITVVGEAKFSDAVQFLMKRSKGPTLTIKERKAFSECWRGPFYHGMTAKEANQVLREGFHWVPTPSQKFAAEIAAAAETPNEDK
jgi:hypothetical protein